MTNESDNHSEAAEVVESPGRSYFSVYLLSAAMILAGLAVISFHVAIGIGVIVIPALAVVVGLLSRRQPWRRALLRHWVPTSAVIAVLFLVPGHFIYHLATTPRAMFQRLVLNPVPASVNNISK